MSNENSKKPWEDTIKWAYESARQKENIYKQTKKELTHKPSAKAFLKQFQNVEHNIDFYAWQKSQWMVDRPHLEWCLEYRSLNILLASQACLGNIQQKKLFDKQCEWRAEIFKHPSIETTHDFIYWEKNILNCPFISPISEEDIALYLEFLKVYLGENLTFLSGWQDYNSFNSSFATVAKTMQEKKEKKEGEDDDDDEEEDDSLMPPWYIFVNEHTGNGHYLLLPDVRQEKEWKYSRIGQEEERRIHIEKLKKNQPDKRPFLFMSGKDQMENFINQVEEDPKEILKAYNVHQQFYNNPEEEEMDWVKEAWSDLEDCFESFPIAAGITDWKEALITTARQWTNTKIARNLPFFYQDYLFRNASGIANACDEEKVESYSEMVKNFKESILLGRALSGEPRDFNF